ncbi:hypothetical protein L210DRAFT_3657885 [Boletus edulis BED1]|uniref:Crinkler effector protein N-terminal domain-containing protein n=1 Tax=Boletus edulis BED1 TaxID=1328754 RepID=A0AAD4BAM0_BOLED|nr:hypothetical protein L210DRAFT_3657885 [Boletus edulis BED1]
METLTLYCWVYGEYVETIFQVKIPRTETVASLKEAIKNKKPVAFRDMDVGTLALYKVTLSGSSDEELEENLKKLSLDKQDPCLAQYYTAKSLSPDATDRVFEVKIPRAGSVAALKEAIKDKKPVDFRDVDAESLALYKLRDPVTGPYDENLNGVILSEHGELLRPSNVLSEAFPTPSPARHIHIIVDSPSLMIVCWLRGSTLDSRFQISIRADATMSQLKGCMKESESVLRDVGDGQIRLFRISGDEDELRECLNKIGDGEPLQGDTLVPNFLGVPVLDLFYVVAEVSSTTRSTNPPPLSHPDFGGTDPIKAAREDFIKACPQNKSPSGGSHPSSFCKTQGEGNTRILCGRPRDPEELIPVTLLHPVFGQFLDDCQTGTMKKDDNQFVGELSNAMSNLYDDEERRVQAVTDLFKAVQLDFNIREKIPGTQYMMDVNISPNDQRLPCYVIAEFKNEAATSTSDPYMQAVAYYLEATRAFAPRMSGSALPCFILVLFGPYIVFAGAVWNLRPVVQVLSTPLAFHYHSTDTHNQLTVARHMAAFRKAVRTLNEYYQHLSITLTTDGNSLSNQLSHGALFPYRTEFESLDDGITRNIRYTVQFMEAGEKKGLVFFGTLQEDDTDQICIKFSRRYSKEAHLHCAESGFAPKLRGFEELPGGWYMAVMDRLLGYDQLADLPETERLPKSVFDTFGKQLKTLHTRHLVHGDIRDTNIMVKNDDRTTLMLIDFEWAGEEDVVRYPPYVNYTNISRPKDARDGLPIKAVHDLAMLEGIIDVRAEK